MHKTTDEGWDKETSVILDLSTLFCIHKSTGEIWDPYRLVILIQKTLPSIQKAQMMAGTHETSNSDAYHGVLNAQNDR